MVERNTVKDGGIERKDLHTELGNREGKVLAEIVGRSTPFFNNACSGVAVGLVLTGPPYEPPITMF